MIVLCAANCIPVLIQQNVNGSNFFNRSWAEFKVGFNDSLGNYWLGNDVLHQLTVSGNYKLRFDLLTTSTGWYWAEYGGVVVLSETNKYKLIVSRYWGNADDAFSYQGATYFTTYDRDNDWRTNDNCATFNGGGFWYNSCARASVNTVRGRGDGFVWNTRTLQTSRMWLTC